MAGFYESLQAGTKSLLSDLQSTTVTVQRVTSSVPSADSDYSAGSVTRDSYTMPGVVMGVEQEYVDGELVKADDLQIIVSPFATKNGTEQTFEPLISDEFSINSKVHVANKIERVPAAGTPVVYLIFVKR
jgi:hypothetical protein